MDKAEFHALYQRYSGDVFRFSLYLSGQRAEAEDLTAETFMRAWTAADGIRTETVKAYLLSIASNLVREGLRKRSRPAQVSGEPIDPLPGPLAEASGRLELRAVLRALQFLPPTDRAALLMKAQEGLSHEEIARALRLSVSAVRVKIHRARLRLDAIRLRDTLPS